MTEQPPRPEHLRDIIPDHLGVITGWRGWQVAHGSRLMSCALNIVWEPRVPLKAFCTRGQQHARLVGPAFSGSKYAPQLGENLIMPYNLKPATFGPEDMLWVPRSVMPPEPVTKVEPVPWDACSCGIYAKDHAEEAMPYGVVFGQVALWGRVVVCDHGWRAEYAYPQELYVDDEGWRQELSRAYGVPAYPKAASRLFVVPAEIGPSEPVTLKWIRRVAYGMLTVLMLVDVILLVVAIIAVVIRVFHLP